MVKGRESEMSTLQLVLTVVNVTLIVAMVATDSTLIRGMVLGTTGTTVICGVLAIWGAITQ